MSLKTKPAPPSEPPIWGFALFLSALVICLLGLVVRTLLPGVANRPDQAWMLPQNQLSAEESSRKRTPPFEYKVKAVSEAPAVPTVAAERAPETIPTPPLPAPLAPPLPWPRGPSLAFGGVFAVGPGQPNYRTAILGEVLLHGTPPAEQALDLSGDAYCAALQGKPPSTRYYVVGAQKGLADVLVFVRSGLGRKAPDWPSSPRRLGFTNCQIAPYVVAGRTHERLDVRNSDGAIHALRLKPTQSPELLERLYPGTTMNLSLPVIPELFIPCRCDTHPWESAWVCVLEHPYFAVTGTDGRFAITNVPPGKYVLEACHQKTHGTNGITREVTIRAGEVVPASFVVEVGG